MVNMKHRTEDTDTMEDSDYSLTNHIADNNAHRNAELARRKDSKKRMRTMICWVLGVLLGIVLTIGTLLAGFYFGALNKSLVFKSLSDSDYYEDTLAYFYEASYDLTLPSGLPVDVLANAVTLDQVKTDIDGYVEACFAGSKYECDTSALESHLTKACVDYVEKTQLLEMTDDNTRAIDEFVREITTQYKTTVSVQTFMYIGSFHTMFQKIALAAILISLIFTAVICLLVSKMYTYHHRGLRFAAYGTLSATIMTGVVPLYLLIAKPYLRLGLSPEFFYNFAMTYIHNSLWVMILCSGVLMILSAVLIVIVEVSRARLVRNAGHVRANMNAVNR